MTDAPITVTIMSSTIAPSDPIVWVAVTDDLWAASRGGDFVGTVERIENRFVAIDGRGAPVGVNGSLEGAQRRLESPAPLALGGRIRRRMPRPRVRRTAAAA
jgi:hypothetical protein